MFGFEYRLGSQPQAGYELFASWRESASLRQCFLQKKIQQQRTEFGSLPESTPQTGLELRRLPDVIVPGHKMLSASHMLEPPAKFGFRSISTQPIGLEPNGRHHHGTRTRTL